MNLHAAASSFLRDNRVRMRSEHSDVSRAPPPPCWFLSIIYANNNNNNTCYYDVMHCGKDDCVRDLVVEPVSECFNASFGS